MKKRVISESAIRYKLYEAALESGITSDQYRTLMEAGGVMGWIKGALASMSAGKEIVGDLKKMFGDKKNMALYKQSTDAIQKAVADMFEAGAKAGVDKQALKDWLVAGIEKIAETSAANAPAAASGEGGAEKTDGTKPGTPVDPKDANTAVPTLAAAAGEAAKQDPEKAKEQAVEKKVDVPKATQVLAKALSSVTKVDAAKVSKVIDYLIQNKHLVAEGRRVMQVDILAASREVLRLHEDIGRTLRINSLAGLLTEAEEIPQDVAGKFESLKGELRKHFKEDEIDDNELLGILWRLDDLDSIQIK